LFGAAFFGLTKKRAEPSLYNRKQHAMDFVIFWRFLFGYYLALFWAAVFAGMIGTRLQAAAAPITRSRLISKQAFLQRRHCATNKLQGFVQAQSRFLSLLLKKDK